MDIEIKEIEEWKNLRMKLKQDYSYDDKWKQAIELFDTRIKRKFFNPV